MTKFRIGQGFDVHRISLGRKLMLGGVEIPEGPGLEGHSDADVLVHAVVDALLGALCLGDIGSWFPDSEAINKDADSIRFLREVYSEVRAQGWSVANVDTVVLAERPKIRPYAAAIQARLSEVLEIEPSQVSVKATTTERLGFVGREEGMAASAIVLLAKV